MTDTVRAERSRRAYNTYYRQLMAVRRHLIGMGMPDVGHGGQGYARRITIPGLNVRVRTNLRRDINKRGRGPVFADMTNGDNRPLIVFEVPTHAEDPEEFLVTMPIQTFVHIMRRNP